MQCRAFPVCRDLNARHEADPGLHRGPLSLGKPGGRIVIGQGKRANAARGSTRNQLRRPQGSVRFVGMGVEIDAINAINAIDAHRPNRLERRRSVCHRRMRPAPCGVRQDPGI